MLNPSQACKLFGYSALASNSCLPQWSYAGGDERSLIGWAAQCPTPSDLAPALK
jgi:hypothetical protein